MNNKDIGIRSSDFLLSDGSIPMDTGFNTSNNLDIATKIYVDSTCSGTSANDAAIPGRIMMWPFNTPPAGYLICDGSTYNYNDYPDLGALLGASTGQSFNVPDINFAKNSKGSNTLTVENEDVGTHGHTSVSHNHTPTIASGGSHIHVFNAGNDENAGYNAGRSSNYTSDGSGESGGTHTHTGSINNFTVSISNYTGVNQPECILINFCIKT